MTELNLPQKQMLARVNENGPKGIYLDITTKTATFLIDNGYIECNNTVVEEGTGKVASRLTEKGVAALSQPETENMENQTAPTAAAAATPAAAPAISIETNVAVPATSRERKSLYPFDQLAAAEIGASFFVPGDKPSKSTVGTASKNRLGVKNGTREITRNGETLVVDNYEYPNGKFISRTVTENGVEGVRVWKVAGDATAE